MMHLMVFCQIYNPPHHRSTETAILRIFSDVSSSLDFGTIDILSLLDLSAAFDSVCRQDILDCTLSPASILLMDAL